MLKTTTDVIVQRKRGMRRLGMSGGVRKKRRDEEVSVSDLMMMMMIMHVLSDAKRPYNNLQLPTPHRECRSEDEVGQPFLGGPVNIRPDALLLVASLTARILHCCPVTPVHSYYINDKCRCASLFFPDTCSVSCTCVHHIEGLPIVLLSRNFHSPQEKNEPG